MAPTSAVGQAPAGLSSQQSVSQSSEEKESEEQTDKVNNQKDTDAETSDHHIPANKQHTEQKRKAFSGTYAGCSSRIPLRLSGEGNRSLTLPIPLRLSGEGNRSALSLRFLWDPPHRAPYTPVFVDFGISNESLSYFIIAAFMFTDICTGYNSLAVLSLKARVGRVRFLPRFFFIGFGDRVWAIGA